MLLTAALSFAWRVALAQTVLVDFEGLRGVHFNAGTPVAGYAMLSNQLAATHGVIFESENSRPYVAVVNLGPGHATSGTNGMGGVAGDNLSYSTPIRMRFVLPFNTSVAAITDYVCVRNDLFATSGGTVQMYAFGLDGELLASASAVDDGAFTLCVTNPGIHSVIITEPLQNSVALDDLSFASPAPPPTNALPVRLSMHRAVAIGFPTESNRLYQVQWSSPANTNAWQSLGPVVLGDGRTNTIHDLFNHRFYRVVPQ